MSAILTGSYDPSKVIVTVGGVLLSQWADGDAIKANRLEDVYSMTVGIDGAVARSRNANKTGEFSFTLLQTSQVNAQLSDLINTYDLDNDGNAVIPISITDGSGNSMANATQCWIKSIPELTFSKDAGSRTWVFSAADLRIYVGGN